MTTAHRPTFDPARGKELPKGPAYHQRLLPAHTKLKVRHPGQGGDADGGTASRRDLHAELLQAEAIARAKIGGGTTSSAFPSGEPSPETKSITVSDKRAIENSFGSDGGGGGGEHGGTGSGGGWANGEEDSLEVKRRKILLETRDIDADSDGGGDDDNNNSSEEDDDEDDEEETAELMRELEKIKRERAEQRGREELEKAEAEQAKKEFDIARGNPLLNPKSTADFNIKRRWDDDVIFKNQARGTDDRNKKKEFVNDLLRSDFHKKFMSKYVR